MSWNPDLKIETPVGPVWFEGRLTGRPVMAVITGAFNEAGAMCRVPDLLPDLDILRAHLPGNHCPRLAGVNIGVFAAGFDHALREVVGDAPLGVFGISTGGLVAMGLTLPNLRRMVLVEPPLRTHDAGWLYAGFPQDGDKAEFVWNLFGARGQDTEPRDYMHLLDHLAVPATVLLGSEPVLPPRKWTLMPSLVDETTRAALAKHPLVRVVNVPDVGHNIIGKAPYPLLDELKRCSAELNALTS